MSNELDSTHIKPFRGCGVSMAEAISGFERMSEAARKVPFPDLSEIGQMRARMMLKDYGLLALLMPEYWRWLFMR